MAFLSLIRTFAVVKRLAVFFLGMLLVLMGCTTAGERALMRAGLDSINIRNRNDQPFTAQDVEPYVRFFDDHGTPNDQLLAHYLLGRAYHEHGEAPIALQCYHDALDCADTTAQDCDFAQLSRVYGQMALIFYQQGLYRQMLTYEQYSEKYAWKGQDTLAALMSYEQESQAHRNLNIPDSLLYICEHVSQLYRKYGYLHYSASALFHTIRILIIRKQFDKARNNMQIYESESGYFDTIGNIQKGREIYYRIKGLYFLHTNILDSAEHYFRKELRDGKDFNNQHSGSLGLAELYQIRQQTDSTAKYYKYAYDMSDSLYAQRKTKDIERIQAMYNYSRSQELAQKEKENAAKEKRKLYFSVSLSLLIIAISAYIIYVMSEEKLRQQELYRHNLEQLEQTQSEILQLRIHADEYEELLAEKEKLLEQQSAEMQMHRQKLLMDHSVIEKSIKESDIYQLLLGKQYGQALSIGELRECRKLVIENLPEFNSLLLSKQYKLNAKDFNVCILFRLGFKSKEISNMLDITQGRVSQICTKVLKEIFGEDTGGTSELIAMLHKLY